MGVAAPNAACYCAVVSHSRDEERKRPFYLQPSNVDAIVEWEQRLRDDGFEDIEHRDPGTGDAHRFFRARPSRAGPLDEERTEAGLRQGSTLEYYLRAERAARGSMDGETPFWQSVALAMHSQGHGFRLVARATGRGRETIGKIVDAMKRRLNP